MKRSLQAVIVAVAVLWGCASDTSVVSAAEVPFPNDFVQAGEWENVELVLGLPARAPSLQVLVNLLDAGLSAGIRASRPGSGVTIAVPDGAFAAREVHLFITVVGGATENSAGMQLRVVAYRDERGWWLDRVSEGRVYCDAPLGGPFRRSCS